MAAVNKIRDFNSGILKQLVNVLAMEASMAGGNSLSLGSQGLWQAGNFARSASRFDFGAGRSAEGVRTYRQLFVQFAVTENLHAVAAAINQSALAQHQLVHARALSKAVQRLDVDRQIARGEAGIIKTALRNAADERHLTALEPDADRAAGTGCLALAAATAGLAVATGFALTEPLATVLGAGA